MTAATLATALATTTPSPGPTDSDLAPGDLTSASAWWDWLLGVPLRIAIIVVVSAIVLVVLRSAIRRVTDHVAEGTPALRRGVLKPIGDSAVGATLLKADPIATARRAQRARTLGSVLRSTATILVGSIAVILVLDALSVNVAPFIASAGIVGVALGFGAQSLVKDFLTGTFMLLEDQYGVGDVVDVGPANGTVEAVTLRVTKIRDDDGTLWYVPNGTMLRVGNKTQGWATAVVEVDVDYWVDLDEARSLLTRAARAVAADPSLEGAVLGAPRITGIEKLTADAVTLRMRVRTSPAMQWEVARALRTAVRSTLEEAGVPLAGQRDALTAYRARAQEAASGGADDQAGGSTAEEEPAEDAPQSADDARRPRDPHATPVEEALDPPAPEPPARP
ncbi:mechanosensitive ion channel family protein [Cellulomonas sp. DKR-3]|uniref:Mechanosensitive ion channel family protein n=1 Tax=Cellulomonas fulva TaxID=2835530 RepID=A0ABS5U2L9_9CELL|nr:mechanosensitive ion channel family protein [Cellulomonas fulva]MBT0995640.1 mechanosensitive ion channel family protein [Cellulomonas fulva]